MRKIAANLIFPISGPPLRYGYLEIDPDGKILRVVDTGGRIKEIQGLEYYSGVLVPGLVNAHCHLELSHLKGMIDPGTGLPSFLRRARDIREQPAEPRLKAMQKALNTMWASGIQAIGDVCNTPDSFVLKSQAPMESHSFIELFDHEELSSQDNMASHLRLAKQFYEQNLSVSLAPHAPYSVSEELLSLFTPLTEFNNITTLHYKEHESEQNIKPKAIIQALAAFRKILLVHNLFVQNDDLRQWEQASPDIFWVLCPNSNRYIQNRLPDVPMFRQHNQNICLGTDSLASNTTLSVLEEMKTISAAFPEIPFAELLQWATLNGARALNMEVRLGSFDPGKKPGVLLISGFDFKKQQLTAQSQVQRLV